MTSIYGMWHADATSYRIFPGHAFFLVEKSWLFLTMTLLWHDMAVVVGFPMTATKLLVRVSVICACMRKEKLLGKFRLSGGCCVGQ